MTALDAQTFTVPTRTPHPDAVVSDIARTGDSLLTFPGVESDWPRRLSGLIAGRPWLQGWVDCVIAEVAEWVHGDRQQASGWFDRDVREVLSADCDEQLAGQAPFALAGTVLTNLASLTALEADGLDITATRATGHSAGLLSAVAVGGGVDAAAQAVKLALIMGITATNTARRSGAAIPVSALAAQLEDDSVQRTPMAAVSGIRREELIELLPAGVELAMTNSLTQQVVSGTPEDLQALRETLDAISVSEARDQKLGRLTGSALSVSWEPLMNAVPFHHSMLSEAVQDAVAWAAAEGVDLAATVEVIDPAAAQVLADDTIAALTESVLSTPQNWYATLLSCVGPQTVIIGVADNPGVHKVTQAAVSGTGAAFVSSEETEDRQRLFTPGRQVSRNDYSRFLPTRDGDVIVTKHTRLTGRSPFILAGMTPTTVDVGIVAAAANAGHVAELAGGGQVSERIFSERMAELGEVLEPGQEVVFNALHLDPYLWDMHLGSSRLVQKARAKGAPLCGVTISAGIPEREDAVALLDQLNELGLWLNALKPGSVKQVDAALKIAADTDHLLWLHVEGGQAGGHHSWENLEELLLATYRRIREHDNVVLAVGGGVDSAERAAELLTGQWSVKYGAPPMPVDALLLGTVTMACAESTASASVKELLASVEGPASGWVRRAEFEAGMTSGLSGLNSDIFFVDNSASRTAALLDEVAGDADAVAQRRDEIIAALARTAKPYFGDAAHMTYEQVLRRFVELAAIGRNSRYQDGVWLDESHRDRFLALLQRAEARLSPIDSGTIPTLYGDPQSASDPAAAIEALLAEYPQAATSLLHPADVDFLLVVCRRPGKPVPFVPVIDADVRRWYQSDALWQSHDEHYDADQVLIIPGPAAVRGITRPDESVAELFARFESEAIAGLQATAHKHDPLLATLAAPTVDWAGQRRPNPLLRIAPVEQWDIANAAVWTDGDEYARLTNVADGAVELELGWAPTGAGDGSVRIRFDLVALGRGIDVRVSADSLKAAGAAALGISSVEVSDPQSSHAALLGSATVLPDAAMRGMWPEVFEAIGSVAAQGMLDLVHARHSIASGSEQDAEVLEVADTAGGVLLTTVSHADGLTSTDQFFIAQPNCDVARIEAQSPAGPEWIDTPHLLLGELKLTAPTRLETFARVTADMNPIHRSDALARFVGLPGRIVHGMWTSALGQRAAIEYGCGADAERLLAWEVSFTAPVLPGAEVTASVTRTGVADGNRRIEVLIESEGIVVATGLATVEAPKTAYVFPGQGIQHVGMGMDGYARSEAAKEVWDTADAHCRKTLGFSILTVVRDNPTTLIGGEPGDPDARITYRHPAGVLYLTQFTQVAMATMASAQVAEMRERGVFDENGITAGHSVGEYNALAAVTGTLALGDLLELVFARGTAMHHLVPRAADGASDFALAVVRPHLAGLNHPQTDALVRSVADDLGQLCEIVNHNLKGKQYAVAGTIDALDELQRRLGAGANGKAPFLLVPGIDVPFHSSALRDGVPEFRAHLEHHLPETIDPAALVGRYVPNLYPVPFAVTREYVQAVQEVCGSTVLTDLLATWDKHSPGQITRTLLVELLAWQFAMPVRWIETTEVLCQDLMVERIVEVGAGAQPTLTNLTKGALALPGHRGTKPAVLNVEADVDDVFELTSTPAPVIDTAADEPVVADEAPVVQAAAVAAPTAVADAPVTHETALRGLVAARTAVRWDQVADDSIEDLVDGASSRRNQLLMDIGKEFGVSGMDGAHEVPLSQVASVLSEKAAGYRFPGPVLSAWLDSELTTTVGRLGGGVGAIADRVRGHWGLPDGWVGQTELELALGAREGTSKRSGELATISADSLNALIDAAVSSAADRMGVTVAPASAAAASSSVDAAAVAEITDRFEDVLADAATAVLRGLDKMDAPQVAVIDDRAVARLGQIDAEHGSGHAESVTGTFDPDRHVHLESASTWALADVDHLVQAAAAGRVDQNLADQVALHREAEPRIEATLRWYADRAAAFGHRSADVSSVIEQVLSAKAPGIAVDIDESLTHLDGSAAGVQELSRTARDLTARPGAFSDEVVLVTGASPGSIALATVRHLLRGSATVVLVTSNDAEERIAQYRDLERQYAGPGAQLHIVRANLASFSDVDGLLDWMTTPTVSSGAAGTQESKPALWPTLVLPFAAGLAAGSLADTGPDNEVSLRLMLLGVQRLIGGLGERIIAAGERPARVVLPLSPNHGTFGGDGAYGDSKAALETVLNRWHAEQKSWGAGVRLAAVEIGWVKGTGLMAGNDEAASAIEQQLGIHTFTSDEMGTLIAAVCAPQLAAFTDTPWRVDLTGGLSAVQGIADVLQDIVTDRDAEQTQEPQDTIDALPNLAWRTAPEQFEVEPTISLDDMVVIAGIAELGPWGGSATRWAAETDSLSADAVTELAWRMGLISWDPQSAAWTDAEGNEVEEAKVAEMFAEVVDADAGVRELAVAGDVEADGTLLLSEVYLDKPLTIGGVEYPAGTAIRVPTTRPLQRQVGGQFPRGVDPARHGLETSLAMSMDPLAAWNLVITAEAIAAAGVTPEELSEAVHPSRIGNVQGTGMGGMNSLHQLYIDPILGKAHANDLLQEALGNVVSAHVNQSLVGGYGPMVHPVAACATAAVSLEEAVDKIRVGKADILVAGGWDDLSSEGINGFADMAATADNAELLAKGIPAHAQSRPGDRRRGGFVESQGGGSFLVVRASTALALGLPVRAVVVYAGSYGDGVQTSIPAPGLGALGAARGGVNSPLATALGQHGLTVDDIAVVSKHDTSTHANDPNEALIHATISEALGRTPGAPLRVVSQKSLTGHAKGGAAAWQLSGLCDILSTGTVPGNRNLVSVDPRVTVGPLVVDYRTLHRAEPVRAAMLTSLGFGHVSALVAVAHPAVLLAAIPESQRDEYVARSSERAHAGQQALLAARYGGDPVFQRRTQRPEKQAEIDLLIGADA